MATVTVPGVAGSVITYNFSDPANTTLAQAIQFALQTALSAGALNVVADNGGAPPSPTGTVNELAVATSGGTVANNGYQFVADSTGGGSFTVTGAQNFIGGDGGLAVYNIAGTALPETITAGNGNDLFALVPGSTYNVAAGSGSDTYFANGSGNVSSGPGQNLIFVGGDNTSNTVVTSGTDTVVAGAGNQAAVLVGSNELVFGGPGNIDVFGNGAASETIVGGAGSTTIWGGSSALDFFGSGSALLVNGPNANTTMVGSTGAETAFGGASAHEVAFVGSSSLLFAAGSNDSTTIVGGTNPATLFGSAGSSITYFSTAGGALYSAGSGSETLNAAGSTSANTIFGGSGNDSLAGGAGNDLLVAGTGNSTLSGGGGNNTFLFVSGHAGGVDIVTDFNANDLLLLSGYGPNAGGNALANATVSGGSTTIGLADNTKITFDNITTPGSIKTFSV
ncbi:MAG TPA: calcium-binding protein [Acetobacteraceae bacterium]